MNTTMTPLVFQGEPLKPLSRAGQIWLRMSEIEQALGYAKKGSALAQIFKSHTDEFTATMTKVVKLATAGGKQSVRIFSLRGAHLLAMFARTDTAKAFRVWVLNILDAEIERQRQAAAPARIAGDQLAALKEICQRRVMEKVNEIPDMMNRGRVIEPTFRNMTSALLRKFNVEAIEDLRADQFPIAREFMETVATTWEIVDEEKVPPVKYHYPISAADLHDRDERFGDVMLSPKALMDPCNRALEVELMDQLARDGHDVSGARIRITAMREGLARYLRAQTRMDNWQQRLTALVDELEAYKREQGLGVLFDRVPNPHCPLERDVYSAQLAALGVPA